VSRRAFARVLKTRRHSAVATEKQPAETLDEEGSTVAASLCRGVPSLWVLKTRRHSAVATSSERKRSTRMRDHERVAGFNLDDGRE
jgi:hypothetical protein